MMSSMHQSFSVMATEGVRYGVDIEVDLEKFDELYETVAVDDKEVAEFRRKIEERARRKKQLEEEKDNDPDLLRDTPRLILFESEKSKKRGKKKKGTSKFSKEFLDAIRQVFGGDSEAEESDYDDEEKEGDEKVIVSRSPSMATSRRASEGSMFVGSDIQSDSKSDAKIELEENLKKLTEETDSKYSDDDLTKSRRSLMSSMSKSIRSIKSSMRDADSASSPNSTKKSPRKRKLKIDPAEVFAEEMKKQEGVKILSTNSLKQEMADMKRGMSRKMMERELANLRKVTANKFSPFEEQKAGPSLFEDYNTAGKSSYSGLGAPNKPADRPKPADKPKPIGGGTGLGDLLARNEANKDEEAMRLDDLATVALNDESRQLPNLANITSLTSQPLNAKNTKKKKPVAGGVGGVSEGGGGGVTVGGNQGDPFNNQSKWDDESKAGGKKPGAVTGAGNANNPGIKEKMKLKAPKLFGKKRGGEKLDDDDGGDGGLLSNY